MKKSLILILFTFICFITFINNVFAEEKCYWCAEKSQMNGYLIWSDKAPSGCLNGVNRVVQSVTKENCTGTNMSFNDATKLANQAQKENEESTYECYKCVATHGIGTRFIWSNSKANALDEARDYNDNWNCNKIDFTQEACAAAKDKEYTKNEAEELESNPENYVGGGGAGSLPSVGFGEEMSCSELLGPSLTKLVSILLDAFKIAAMILCTVQMMMALIPPITNKDSDALNKALKKCVTLAIIFVCALLIDTFVVVIGRLFGFDLSCFR